MKFESLQYLVLFLIFVVFIVFLILTLKQDQELNAISQSVATSERLIIQNQVNGSAGIKIYIDCILHINPAGDIHAQEKVCFSTAPQVKK